MVEYIISNKLANIQRIYKVNVFKTLGYEECKVLILELRT